MESEAEGTDYYTAAASVTSKHAKHQSGLKSYFQKFSNEFHKILFLSDKKEVFMLETFVFHHNVLATTKIFCYQSIDNVL